MTKISLGLAQVKHTRVKDLTCSERQRLNVSCHLLLDADMVRTNKKISFFYFLLKPTKIIPFLNDSHDVSCHLLFDANMVRKKRYLFFLLFDKVIKRYHSF